MNRKTIELSILLILGIWIGLLLGISFIEAPLKFQAPGITTALGLGIGKLVFGALDKIQIVLSLLIIVLFYLHGFKQLGRILTICLTLLIFGQIIQSGYLFPALDLQADAYISNSIKGPNTFHISFIVIEVLKVLLLFTIFIKFFTHE